MKRNLFALLLFLTLGLTLQKTFSLYQAKAFVRPGALPSESSLLLTQQDGLLSEAEVRKLLRLVQAPVARTHTVGRNEWLEKIAKGMGVPALSIRSTNNLEDKFLRPGQKITVQNKSGMMHVARRGESLEAFVRAYEKLGSKREKILASNPVDEIAFFQDGELVLREGAQVWAPDARRSFPDMARPVSWSRISGFFGYRKHPLLNVKRFHDGYDMVAPYGAPVYAGDQGVVIYAGPKGGYGNAVEIRHARTTTRYGHLSSIRVEAGQKVKRKQLIGRVGSSGLSTGAHLHFEVWRNSDGKLQNPRKYLF